MDTEKWMPVAGFSYEISDLGRLRNAKGQLIKWQTDRDGYQTAALYNSSGRKAVKAHRLVAQAFLPNPDNLSDVDHINADKRDNRAVSLQWMSAAENKAKETYKRERWYVFRKGDELVTFRGLNNYCREHGLSSSQLAAVDKLTLDEYCGHRSPFQALPEPWTREFGNGNRWLHQFDNTQHQQTVRWPGKARW